MFKNTYPQHSDLNSFESGVYLVSWLIMVKRFKRCKVECHRDFVDFVGNHFGLDNEESGNRWLSMAEKSDFPTELWPKAWVLKFIYLFM